jgi:hypothetical protein
MALTATIGGITVTVMMDQLSLSKRIGGRTTCTLLIVDLTNTQNLQQNQSVVVTDDTGTAFVGVVEKVEDLRYPGTSTIAGKTVTCKDARYYIDKHQMTWADYVGMRAGDIICDFHSRKGAAEGLVANYALDRDTDAATFGAGTLTGTNAASGSLQLSSAGSVYTDNDTSQADFNTGTLSGVQANSDGTLSLLATNAIRLTGTAASNIGGNLFHYRIIWNGSVTFASGDYVQFDIWISSTSPEISGGLDIACTDGTTLRDHLGGSGIADILDQNQIRIHPFSLLSSLANDQWYTRKFDVTNVAGKTTSHAMIALEGDQDGSYAIYIRNAKIYNSGGGVKGTIYAGGSTMNANQINGNNGYYGVDCRVVKTYERTGYRMTANNSLSAVGCIGESMISWMSVESVQTGNSVNYPPQVEIQASTDNQTTFQTCTNHGSIPNLPPGQTLAKSLTVKQILSVGGPNPELTPAIKDCLVTVSPAYTPAAKSDIYSASKTSGDFGTGTLTNVTYDSQIPASGLKITGKYHNWDDGDFSSQTMWGSDITSPPTQAVSSRALTLRSQGASDSRVQLNWVGNWQNFIAEVDVQIVNSGGNFCYGLVYRTTTWANGRDTYAYTAWINTTAIQLARGSNSGTGAYTLIFNAAVTLNVGEWYRLKVIVSGSSHQIYINNVQYINVTDATHSAAGGIGLRISNQDATGVNRYSAFFDNFGVMSSAFTGSRVHPSVSISAAGTVEDSIIVWDSDIDDDPNVVVEASTNGGSTYSACTNGGQIPGATPGTNVSGKSLLIRTTLTTQNATYSPVLTGLSWTVVGNYTASGTRVSPNLDISPAGTVGGTSVSWDSVVPAGTTVLVESRIGAGSFSTVAASGNAIAGLRATLDPVVDNYDVNSSANYVSSFYSGGSAATMTFDTANSRLRLSGGNQAVILWNNAGTPYSGFDSTITAIIGQCDNFGLILRGTDVNNFYVLLFNDASVASNPNTVRLIKRSASTNTTLLNYTALPIPMTRGGYYALQFKATGTSLTGSINGVNLFTAVTDSTLTSGQPGLQKNTSTVEEQIYALRFDAPGQSAAATTVSTRITLTSSDPTGPSPQIRSLTTCVRSPDIASGAVIPLTSMQYQGDLGKATDWLADASLYWWRVSEAKKILFQGRTGLSAPFPLSSFAGDIDGVTPPKLTHSSPKYRNRQYIAGAYDIVSITNEPHVGDGMRQAWVLTYPVVSMSSVTINGIAYTVGVQGTDTGKDFYYKPDSNVLSQDAAGLPPDATTTLYVSYVGKKDYVAMKESTAQQAVLAGFEGGTGIVEDLETVQDIDKATADALAQARIDQLAYLGRQWGFTLSQVPSPYRTGLLPGQLLYVFVPEHGLNDVAMLITDLSIHYTQQNGVTVPIYDVQAVDGPKIDAWTKFFSPS